jgi:hypothetical protein
MLVIEIIGRPLLVIIPTIFYFGYKEVRNMWVSITTCGLCPRQKTSPGKDMSQFKVNLRNIVIPYFAETYV